MKYRLEDDPNVQGAEAAKREQAIAIERRRWWELEETYRRCVAIADTIWRSRLVDAAAEQDALAIEMRNLIAKGKRATGAEYEIDKGIPVPLLTPRDQLQFVKEVAATLLISTDRRNLPVTPEANREKTQAPEAAKEWRDCVEVKIADQAVNLAQAGDAPHEAQPAEAQEPFEISGAP